MFVAAGFNTMLATLRHLVLAEQLRDLHNLHGFNKYPNNVIS